MEGPNYKKQTGLRSPPPLSFGLPFNHHSTTVSVGEGAQGRLIAFKILSSTSISTKEMKTPMARTRRHGEHGARTEAMRRRTEVAGAYDTEGAWRLGLLSGCGAKEPFALGFSESY
ncbi:hypothetical protein V6Z12_A05G308400 [Gossypium hirsutum]